MKQKEIILDIFANRLRKLRESRQLSTRQLAEMVGTSYSTISRYETGQRDPELMTVYNIANFFGVSVEYLCGEDIDTNTETLIELYSKLSDESKKDAIKYITYLYEKGE